MRKANMEQEWLDSWLKGDQVCFKFVWSPSTSCPGFKSSGQISNHPVLCKNTVSQLSRLQIGSRQEITKFQLNWRQEITRFPSAKDWNQQRTTKKSSVTSFQSTCGYATSCLLSVKKSRSWLRVKCKISAILVQSDLASHFCNVR